MWMCYFSLTPSVAYSIFLHIMSQDQGFFECEIDPSIISRVLPTKRPEVS